MLGVDFFEFLGGVLILAVGVPIVLAGGWWTVSNLKMRSRATGTIVDIKDDGEGGTDLVVEFRTHDNTRARFTNDIGCIFHLPPRGSSVPVRYDPRDHREARIATFRGSWSVPFFLLLFGGFLLGMLLTA